MPFARKNLRAEGLPTPAVVNLSPVARDHPSRVFNESFQTVALRLFYQGTCSDCDRVRVLGRVCSAQLLHRANR
jgi:hypothetical protein